MGGWRVMVRGIQRIKHSFASKQSSSNDRNNSGEQKIDTAVLRRKEIIMMMILCLCFLGWRPVFFFCFCTSGSYRQQLDIQIAQMNYMEVLRADFNTVTLRFSQQLLQTENFWNVIPRHWASDATSLGEQLWWQSITSWKAGVPTSFNWNVFKVAHF
jgi:hypothetical protein